MEFTRKWSSSIYICVCVRVHVHVYIYVYVYKANKWDQFLHWNSTLKRSINIDYVYVYKANKWDQFLYWHSTLKRSFNINYLYKNWHGDGLKKAHLNYLSLANGYLDPDAPVSTIVHMTSSKDRQSSQLPYILIDLMLFPHFTRYSNSLLPLSHKYKMAIKT